MNPHETNVRRSVLRPAVDVGLESVAVRTAVPEKLGDLDLVCAADRWLCRYKSYEVLVLFELPLRRRARSIRLREQYYIFFRVGFRRRFLNDFQHLVFRDFLNSRRLIGFCNRLSRNIFGNSAGRGIFLAARNEQQCSCQKK